MNPSISTCLYHSGFEARLESICAKLDLQMTAMDKALDVAKEEMDRRLDGMNHLSTQLTEQRAENRSQIEKLSSSLFNLMESTTKFSVRMEALERISNERRGSSKWSDHIVTVLIASGIMLAFHYLWKF